MWRLGILFAALACLLGSPVYGSFADKTKEYKSCLASCASDGCPRITSAQKIDLNTLSERGMQMPCSKACDEHIPFGLYGTVLWTCSEDCNYLCQHEVKAQWALDGDTKERKFFGRWAFKRVWGIHEIASVVFSVGNLIENVRGGFKCRKLHKRAIATGGDSVTDRDLWRMWLWRPSWYCTIVAWLLSVWYHLKPRDQDLAELMDVTVAGTVPALGFAYALGVATGLSATGLVRALLLLVAGQTTHAISMFFIYSNARQLAWVVLIQVLQAPLWILWTFGSASEGHPSRWHVLTFAGLMNVCFLLEVYDFAPVWGIFDAHSVWHMVTIPVVHFWYDFIAGDLEFMERKYAGADGKNAALLGHGKMGEKGSEEEEEAEYSGDKKRRDMDVSCTCAVM